MSDYKAYVGLDVPKDQIVLVLARPGPDGAEWLGTLASRRSCLKRRIGRLAPKGERLNVCSAAGPCG